MYVTSQIHHIVEWLSPAYHALFFAWPPFLVFLLRNRRRLMARLITLWTVSSVLSVLMVMAKLSPITLLPNFGPEPYNTVILVCLRLAMLVLLASLMVRPRIVLA